MSIRKYLSRYAADEAERADELSGPYAHAVVVPMCDESAAAVDALAPALGSDALCIVVVNGRDAHDPSVHRANRTLLADLHQRDDPFDLVVVDRASPGQRLPDDQGVGLARKIGCDIALAAHHRGALRSRWIHSTDADVTLPADYFSAAETAPDDVGGLAHRFAHQTSELPPPADRALLLYELSLRYYVVGLARARSPYAVHTIGSTLAVDARAYAAVRGFPRRQGAEDFYLINKLAKVTRIARAEPRITLHGRPSARVPFGTGPAIRRISAQLDAGQAFQLYHPASFALLGEWLARMEALAEGDDDALDDIDPRLAAAIGTLGLPRTLAELREGCTTPAMARRRAHEHFDAFKTLKLIHALRDQSLPMQPWGRALEAWSIDAAAESANRALEALEPPLAGL